MPKFLELLFALLLVLVATPAQGVPCLPGTLASYIALGATGCQIGSTSLADFATVPGQTIATPIDPSTVQLTPTGGGANASLVFTLNRTATSADVLESFLRFDIRTPAGLFLTAARARLDGASASADGAVTLVEDLCVGATFAGNAPVACPTTAGTLIALVTAQDDLHVDSATFASPSFFDVFADITIDAGPTGAASLASGILTFTTSATATVPEPCTAALLALAAGLFGVRSRRRTRDLS
jgi:hypothetical protein